MIIDIHGHLSPPEAAKRFPMPPSLTDVDGMIEQRAVAGIDLTIIGSPVGAGAMMRVPGVDNYRQPADRLRAFHDWLAGLVERYSEYLRAYVYVNPLGDEDHLSAVAQTLENPHFVGLITNSSVNGQLLQGQAADSFYAFAAEHRRPILLHPPAEPVGGPAVEDFRFVEQVLRFGDVTNGLAMIAFEGWLRKYPDLTVIGAGGGGSLALLTEKLDVAARPRHWAGLDTGGREPGQLPSADVHRLYVDTASPSRLQLADNIRTFGAERVLFGTDSPPLAMPLAVMLDAVWSLDIPEQAKELILGGNAARLFGLHTELSASVGAAGRQGGDEQ